MQTAGSSSASDIIDSHSSRLVLEIMLKYLFQNKIFFTWVVITEIVVFM